MQDNDINGVVLLDLDDELLEEMEIEVAKRKVILQVRLDNKLLPHRYSRPWMN